MGIIEKQAVKGTIYTYMGVILGFVTTGILFPRILSPEENGLIKLLVSYSAIFAQLATLGFGRVTTMLFTYFRDKEKKHHGFLFIAISVASIGLVICVIILLLLKQVIIGEEKAELFTEYFYYIIPLIIVVLFFTVFDSYYKVLYNTVIGTFLKEFFQRFVILVSIILFYFNLLGFQSFIILYVIAFSLPTIILIISLVIEKQFNLKPEPGFLNRSLSRKMASVSFFGILTSFSGKLVLNIDSIMINAMIGISQTGIYAITYFFGSIILIPSRSLIKISSVIIADAWKKNDLDMINKIYYKSCINQFIFAILLFIGIWANIHSIFIILPPEYLPGKYVIFFIGLSCLFQMLGGMNSIIISISRYYKVQTYFMIILVVLIIITNLIFIPLYGIVGAAIASALSNLIFNLLKFFFLWIKFKFQPYDYKYILILIFAVISYYIGYLIPQLDYFITDIIIRSLVIAFVFGSLVLLFKISDEFNNKFNIILSILKKNRS